MPKRFSLYGPDGNFGVVLSHFSTLLVDDGLLLYWCQRLIAFLFHSVGTESLTGWREVVILADQKAPNATCN